MLQLSVCVVFWAATVWLQVVAGRFIILSRNSDILEFYGYNVYLICCAYWFLYNLCGYLLCSLSLFFSLNFFYSIHHYNNLQWSIKYKFKLIQFREVCALCIRHLKFSILLLCVYVYYRVHDYSSTFLYMQCTLMG